MRRRPPRSTRFPYTTLVRAATYASAAGRALPTASSSACSTASFSTASVCRGAVSKPPRRSRSRRSGSRASRSTAARSEEHTSELQSRHYLVCRLLLEKKQRPRERVRAAEEDGTADHLRREYLSHPSSLACPRTSAAHASFASDNAHC